MRWPKVPKTGCKRIAMERKKKHAKKNESAKAPAGKLLSPQQLKAGLWCVGDRWKSGMSKSGEGGKIKKKAVLVTPERGKAMTTCIKEEKYEGE